jgi:hypothetical protein
MGGTVNSHGFEHVRGSKPFQKAACMSSHSAPAFVSSGSRHAKAVALGRSHKRELDRLISTNVKTGIMSTPLLPSSDYDHA